MKRSRTKAQPGASAPGAGSTAAPETRTSKTETILLAVTGMSPAVLTETIWALAHPGAKSGGAIIPDRVVAVTTLPGKARIEQELFTPVADYGGRSVWDALRRAILGPQAGDDSRLILDDIRVIASRDAKLGRSFPLEDIRTPADSEVAADFILEEVRRITENADTTLIASLAGGRKTMGALLYASLSLLGRPRDRLTHVLVSEPFEDPALTPRFHFPAQPETLHQHPRTGGVHSSDSARLWLADVPFVRLRELFPKQLGRYPGTFSALVRAYAWKIEEIAGPPEVRIDDQDLALRINGVSVQLACRELAVFTFLFERCRDGESSYRQQKEAIDDFGRWLPQWAKRFGPFTRQRELAESWKQPSEEDLRKQLSGLRKKFIAAGLAALEPFLLPQRGRFGIRVRANP